MSLFNKKIAAEMYIIVFKHF